MSPEEYTLLNELYRKLSVFADRTADATYKMLLLVRASLMTVLLVPFILMCR